MAFVGAWSSASSWKHWLHGSRDLDLTSPSIVRIQMLQQQWVLYSSIARLTTTPRTLTLPQTESSSWNKLVLSTSSSTFKRRSWEVGSENASTKSRKSTSRSTATFEPARLIKAEGTRKTHFVDRNSQVIRRCENLAQQPAFGLQALKSQRSSKRDAMVTHEVESRHSGQEEEEENVNRVN
jgi:hypothetical protein